MQALLPLLILVPCVLMMVMMMRGHGHGHGRKAESTAEESTTELRKRREELDRLIDDREGEGGGAL